MTYNTQDTKIDKILYNTNDIKKEISELNKKLAEQKTEIDKVNEKISKLEKAILTHKILFFVWWFLIFIIFASLK